MKKILYLCNMFCAALNTGLAQSGTADNLIWKISKGMLTITGPGAMPNFNDGNLPPWFEYRNDVINVVIGNGVTTIGCFAFAGFENMISIDIPDTVTMIGEGAFIGCGFSDVEIPDSVEKIGDGAFFGSTITDVKIPSSVTQIRDNTFYECKNLTAVTIPNSVTVIGESAFENCEELIAIEIPNSVTQIGIDAFRRTGLIMIDIPNSVKIIGVSAFEDCEDLISVTLPEGITEISNRLFFGCVNLNKITIPDKVTKIGYCAFYHCRKLSSINIPNSVKTIELKAFAFSGLKNLVIPNYVTTISGAAFYNCKFSSVFIPGSVTKIEQGAFDCEINVAENNEVYSSIDGVLFSKDKTTLVLYPCGVGNKYIIPSFVKKLENRAFDCDDLTSITIPAGLTNINTQQFFNMPFGFCQLTEITNLAVTPQKIDNSTFMNLEKRNCILRVPAGSVEAYRNADFWNEFENIEAIY